MSVLLGSGLSEIMNIKINLEGVVNNHVFSMEALGKGNIVSGTQVLQVRVTRGHPIPFSFDIMSSAFQYGDRLFTKYPPEIPDYFVQSFPAGFAFERYINFEDGAYVQIRSDISLRNNLIVANVEYRGEHFPNNGPVMQRAILGMQPTFEAMFPRDGTLIGNVTFVFKLKGSKYYTSQVNTVYRSKLPVERLPDYHFIQHRLEKTHVEEGNYVEIHETAIAQYSTIAKPIGSLYNWTKP